MRSGKASAVPDTVSVYAEYVILLQYAVIELPHILWQNWQRRRIDIQLEYSIFALGLKLIGLLQEVGDSGIASSSAKRGGKYGIYSVD
jgi:hypothetical protein